MTIRATNIAAAGSTSNVAAGSSYSVGSRQPLPRRLYTLAVQLSQGTTTVKPTINHTGFTWDDVVTVGSGADALWIFRCMPTSLISAATLNITMNTSTHTGCNYSLDEFDGVWLGGTNGADAILQTTTGSAGSGTASDLTDMAAFASPQNLGYVAAYHRANQGTNGTGDSVTILNGTGTSYATPTIGLGVGVKLGDVDPVLGWTTSATWRAAGFEIRAAARQLAIAGAGRQ